MVLETQVANSQGRARSAGDQTGRHFPLVVEKDCGGASYPLYGKQWLRSALYLSIVIARRLRGQTMGSADFEQLYEAGPDTWQYENPVGRERLVRALELLDTATAGRRFQSAFEIGCAEGAFTELLAPRCERLIAADFAATALARARHRKFWKEPVEFSRFDLLSDQFTRSFDLITVMDVLNYYTTGPLITACDKIVGALRGGGHLLFTECKQADIYDRAWWSRWVIRGGQRIFRHLNEHPALALLEAWESDTHIAAVFTKTGG